MTVINRNVVDVCHSYYVSGANGGTGDKIKAIKYLRQEAGLDLKAAKYLIEADFEPDTCKEYDVQVEGEGTPGYHIDMIFELSSKIAMHHQALKELGINIGNNS